MKLLAAVVAVACAAVEAVGGAAASGGPCSSLNGPFCAGLSPGFALAPPHARQNLDVDDEELAVTEAMKNLKVERVLKQYELSEADALEQEEIVLDIEMLLDESMALLSEMDDDEEKSPMAGTFAFSSANGAFEVLEKMDGDELKEFFETALDEVLLSVEAALQELSPGAAEGVRTTSRQLKALKDFSTYAFQRLDETQLANIRHRFTNHRLVELQQTFERLVIAQNAQDRQMAFEAAVFLFQLAQEQAIAAKESEAGTATAAKESEAGTATAAVSDTAE